jgi:hypothetical protein
MGSVLRWAFRPLRQSGERRLLKQQVDPQRAESAALTCPRAKKHLRVLQDMQRPVKRIELVQT